MTLSVSFTVPAPPAPGPFTPEDAPPELPAAPPGPAAAPPAPSFLPEPAHAEAAVASASPTPTTAATCRIRQTAWRGPDKLAEAHVRAAFVAPNGRPRRQKREWVAAFQTVLAPATESPA